MFTQPKTFLTPEEYLTIERKAERKSEYWNGQMFAVAGASGAHTDIQSNLVFRLRLQLQGGKCRVRASDMRVQTPLDLYTYPDVVVICGEPQYADGQFDTLLNPLLIVEILSPSTEGYDRGMKFEQYRGIESLREYLVLASDRIYAELHAKGADGKWTLSDWKSPEDVVTLESCDCRIKVADLYENVEFRAL